MDEVPFPDTFLHGLIYGKSYWRQTPGGGISYVSNEEREKFDKGEPLPKDVFCKWEKMSKSKGNIIDPNLVIAEYGADAMRMALASSTTEAPEIDLDLRRFEEFRNFTNKVWNGARFIFMNLSIKNEELFSGLKSDLLRLEDHWILGRLHLVTKEVQKAFESYSFDKAATSAYEFYWNELCSYYLEISKPVLFGKQGSEELRKNKERLLVIVLLQAIRLMHPMAPFITEEIFSLIKERFGSGQLFFDADPLTQEAHNALQSNACIVSSFPKPIAWQGQKNLSQEFQLLSDIVYAIRNIRGEMKLAVQTATDIHIVASRDSRLFTLAQEHRHIISSLVKVKELYFSKTPPTGPKAQGQIADLELYVSLPEEMQKQEQLRLSKEKERLQKALQTIEVQLANKNFIEKAPPEVVKKLQETKEQTLKELAALVNVTDVV
jgi:valyl-tRNA synthetase